MPPANRTLIFVVINFVMIFDLVSARIIQALCLFTARITLAAQVSSESNQYVYHISPIRAFHNHEYLIILVIWLVGISEKSMAHCFCDLR